MITIIFNEVKYIEDILNSGKVPEDLSITQLIIYLTKYFYYYGITAKELSKTVASTMEAFKLDTLRYRPFKYDPYIKKMAKRMLDLDNPLPPLRNYDSIPLYKSEVDAIERCKSRRQQKLLAVLIFLARYNYNSGCTTESRSTIAKLANINATRKDIDLLAHELSVMDDCPFVGMNYNSNKACTWIVKLSDGIEDEIVYEFDAPVNIGNQVIALINPEYITCECCGRLVKKQGHYDNRRKYCNKCAEEINRQQSRDRMNAKYKEENNSLKTRVS